VAGETIVGEPDPAPCGKSNLNRLLNDFEMEAWARGAREHPVLTEWALLVLMAGRVVMVLGIGAGT